MVAFDEASILFGHEAKQQQGRNVKYTISELKRLLLNRTLTEESIQTLSKQFPFDLCVTKDNRLAIKTFQKGKVCSHYFLLNDHITFHLIPFVCSKTETIPFEDVVGIFFKKLKEVAEQNLGTKVVSLLLFVVDRFRYSFALSFFILHNVVFLTNTKTKALVSVPPNLTTHQKSALLKAAEK
jgi:molecular chaperone DnaK (HSP70)